MCELNLRTYSGWVFFYLTMTMWTVKVKWTDLHDIQERYGIWWPCRSFQERPCKTQQVGCPDCTALQGLYKGEDWDSTGRYWSLSYGTWLRTFTLQDFWNLKSGVWQTGSLVNLFLTTGIFTWDGHGIVQVAGSGKEGSKYAFGTCYIIQKISSDH